MGVQGLYTLLKENGRQLTEPVNLRDTKLIIDANDLLFSIYEQVYCNQSRSEHYRMDVYGGDLTKYREGVIKLFKGFKQCNIEPILVYDGSVIGKRTLESLSHFKEPETKKRGIEQFEKLSTAGDELKTTILRSREMARNHLLNIVFRNIANDFKFDSVVAPYEIDWIVVKLANHFKCPVMTNDSDFLMFPIERGCIFLSTNTSRFLELPFRATGIQCYMYSRRCLLRYFPRLKFETLPLLGAMFSYGYDEALFRQIAESMGLNRRHHYGDLLVKSGNKQRIVNLLAWLQGQSLREAMDKILDSTVLRNDENGRASVKTTLKAFVMRFNNEECPKLAKVLGKIFPVKDDNIIDTETSPSSNDISTPVKFLIDQLQKGTMTGTCLDIIFRTTQLLYRLVDDFDLPTSSLVTHRPYRLALVLLRPDSKIEPETNVYKYYCRNKDNEYSLYTLEQLDTLENYGSLDTLDIYSMLELDSTKRKSLLLSCFRMSSEECSKIRGIVGRLFMGVFVDEATLCLLLVLKYIPKETQNKTNEHFCQALLLTLYYYAALEGQLSTVDPVDQREFSLKLQVLVQTLEPHGIMRNGFEYSVDDRANYRRIMHFITQLQLTYKAYNLINSLLQCPGYKPRHERFFNSTLIFRLTHMFKTDQLKFDQLCQDFPVLLDSFDELVAAK